METIAISAFITIFSAGLLLVSLASYRRTRKKKILLVSLVFLVLLIKGALLSVGLIYPDVQGLINNQTNSLFDVLILFLLFFITIRR